MSAPSDQSNDTVIVVGAGLAGSMMALMLRQRGLKVVLYERNPDFRRVSLASDRDESVFGASRNSIRRSINLALSRRGQDALEKVGLLDAAMRLAVPMGQRVMHDTRGQLSFQPYGTHGECIYSVSRQDLNQLLLEALEKLDVPIHFDHKLMRMDRDGTLKFKTPGSHDAVVTSARLVIGADGAYSAVRDSLMRMARANYSRFYIPHGYKELTIPPGPDGDFALPHSNGLHIWPRGDFMMIGLPNPDKSFTCTLFMPFEGETSFASLPTREAVRRFFDAQFPDAVPVMPDLLSEFFTNPTGPLVTMRVEPWNHGSRVMLIGDAAHAVVPFYGQGMNAAFEDCLVFDELLDQHGGSFTKAVPAFTTTRLPAADGIARLSFANYVEMRAHTASATFLLRKRVEAALHALMPSTWIPLYSMVAFTRIPYHEAFARGQRQDQILTWTGRLLTGAALCGAVALGAKLLRRSSKE
eukprot:CAMPEP_0196770372 /NCGR_PEP_ID=MMETSP1104-20130614/1099_1 /TAXON_ID=33652 /ORGANISM="Cafeteria sp., Strain Caron Lab Isolate" /LENGTH=468 /DNA_ID=CAMNT_0042140483 /DNA_START=35 /DNA_END=1441 /DNA_ORIENTATION=+